MSSEERVKIYNDIIKLWKGFKKFGNKSKGNKVEFEKLEAEIKALVDKWKTE